MSIKHNWQEEKRSVYLYNLIAKYEVDPVRKKLFLELAGLAEKQAKIWEQKWQESHTEKLQYFPDIRTRIVGGLLNVFSIKQLRLIFSAMKVRGMSVYATAPGSHVIGESLEHRHKGVTTAGNLRASVFGVNDGLLSNLSLLCGVAGANASPRFILLSGIAGLLAGAFSMAAGEYVSMASQREFFEYQIELEKEELDLYPEEEATELACIYRARGLPEDEAKHLANLLVKNPKTGLDTLAREELGINPDELGGSAIGAGLFSFLSFSLGAFVPLIPYVFINSKFNLSISLILTITMLFVIGSILSLYTNKSAVKGGLRMLIIGIIASSITYSVGRILGVAL